MNPKEQSRLWPIAREPVFAWAALCVLLMTTVALAYVPLGFGNAAVSVVIAALKAAVIAIVFMELRAASGLVRLAAVAGLIFLFFLLFLVSTDYLTRA